MIRLGPLAFSSGFAKYYRCIACGKNYTEDPDMVQIEFLRGYVDGCAINLCDDCRKELVEKLSKE